MNVAPTVANFNSGEFSPLLDGRSDLKFYASACRKIRNFIPAAQGPARRRPGTRFVARVKNGANRTWLGKFIFSQSQAYVLEIGDFYMRFYANHGVLGAPFELATPWPALELMDSDGSFALRFTQSGDTTYITQVNGTKPMQKLTRTSTSTFAIAPVSFLWGPFRDIDPDNTITISASASTGVVNLVASAAAFRPDVLQPNLLVGYQLLMEQKNVDAIKFWEPGKAIVIGDKRRSDGKNYKALNAANTGSVKPTHSSGSKFDGDGTVQWEFEDPGYGYCTITAIADATHATATVVKRLPDGVIAPGPTTRWAFSVFGYPGIGWAAGHPEHCAIWRERLVVMRKRKVWASVAGDFEDMSDRDTGGVVTAEMSVAGDTITDKADAVKWLLSMNQGLIIGTGGDELALYEETPNEPFGPGNAKSRKQTNHGSRGVAAVMVGDHGIFVQASGRKIRDMKLAESVDTRWESTDLTVLAEHITRTGIVDMAYQQEPDNILWVITADGRLSGFTLNNEQEVKGWHPHRIGGYTDSLNNDLHVEYAQVESIVSIPSPDKLRDDLWMIVRRKIAGQFVRYVEFLEKMHEEEDDVQDAFYVDCGLSLNNTRNGDLVLPDNNITVQGSTNISMLSSGSPFLAGDVGKYIRYRYKTRSVAGKIIWRTASLLITQFISVSGIKGTVMAAWPTTDTIPTGSWRITATTLTGLSHLEGQVVDVCAEGAYHPPVQVVFGTISLNFPASKVHVGLSCPAVVSPMDMEVPTVATRGKVKRPTEVCITVHETVGGKIGRDEDMTLDDLLPREPADLMDEAIPPYTGDCIQAWPDGYSTKARLTFVQDKPLPATIVAITPSMYVED